MKTVYHNHAAVWKPSPGLASRTLTAVNGRSPSACIRHVYGFGRSTLDLDDVLVLSPARSKVDRLADRMAQDLVERGESLESMLQALHETRERYAAFKTHPHHPGGTVR
jgi:hypothetical protein